MNGKHYSHGKRGMLISEAMLQIMLSDFSKESNEKQQNTTFFTFLTVLQKMGSHILRRLFSSTEQISKTVRGFL